MNSATSNQTEFDQVVFDALDSCINKMAGALNKKFNPEEKESKSLFRLFCSSLKTRIMMMKKAPGATANPNQNQHKSSSITNMLNNAQSIFKEMAPNNVNSSFNNGKNKKKSRLNQFLRNRKLA